VLQVYAVAFGDGFTMLLAVCLLALNPLVLDFMVAARRYGMALALWMISAVLLLDESIQPGSSRRTMLAGAALALSVTANLVFVLPAAALAAIAAFLILRRREPVTQPPAGELNGRRRKLPRDLINTPARAYGPLSCLRFPPL